MVSRSPAGERGPTRTRRSESDVTTAAQHGRTAYEALGCVDMDLGRLLSYQGLHYVPSTDTPTINHPRPTTLAHQRIQTRMKITHSTGTRLPHRQPVPHRFR